MKTTATFSDTYPLEILVAAGSLLTESGIAETLLQLGYQPGVAENSQDIIRMTHARRYDLVLVDTRMPGIEEIFIEKNSGHPKVGPLFIAIAGAEGSDFKQTCLQAMADHRVESSMDKMEWMLHLKACSVLAGKCRTRGRG